MNIHKYQKELSDLLLEGSRISTGKRKTKTKVYFPGVYIIARNLGYNMFKLGEAHGSGGLYSRIMGQYKICMSLKSEEFYMRFLVISKRKKKGNKFYSQILEKEFLKVIDSGVEDSYSKEYIFTPDMAELERKMGVVLTSHKEYYSTAIKFTQNGFRVYEEKSGFNTPLLNFDVLRNLNPDVNLLLNLSKPVPVPVPAVKKKKVIRKKVVKLSDAYIKRKYLY
jgi:hypothetical protein